MKKTPTSRVMAVTPQQAQAWLERNTHNRSIRQDTVEKYMRDMREGRWLLTHQGIGFDVEGVLQDGQHRLWAVFESGCTIEMMVTVDLPPESQEVIDGGELRQARDVLALRGESVSPVLVAIAKLLCTQITGLHPTRSEAVEMFDEHREAILFTGKAFPQQRVRGICIAHVMTPVARAFYTQSRPDLHKFAAVLTEGMMTDTAREQPIILLRNHLLERSPKRHEVYGKTERALLAYLRNERIKSLYASTDELFPLPIEQRIMKPKKTKLKAVKSKAS